MDHIILSLSLAALLLGACGPTVRPYFVRSAGRYVTPKASVTPVAAVPKVLSASFDGAGVPGADRLRKSADSYLGVPYSFGGQSRRGMDCSGFVRQVFREALGMDLPRSSSAMFEVGKQIGRGDLRPGDLVFFKGWGFINHSGIYMGANHFIHASTSAGVSYSTLDAPYFADHYAGARRVID